MDYYCALAKRSSALTHTEFFFKGKWETPWVQSETVLVWLKFDLESFTIKKSCLIGIGCLDRGQISIATKYQMWAKQLTMLILRHIKVYKNDFVTFGVQQTKNYNFISIVVFELRFFKIGANVFDDWVKLVHNI